MIRILVLLFIGYILFKLVGNELGKRKQSPTNPERKEPGKNMVKDPTCGVYVDPSSSISVRDDKLITYFCCYECRDRYLENLRTGGRNISGDKTTDDLKD